MKGCKHYFEKISEYLDGELDQRTCREIETHLRECPECRQCADSLQKTIQLCRETSQEHIPAEMRARLKWALQECFERSRL